VDVSKEYIKMCEKAYPNLANPRTLGLPTLWAKNYDPQQFLLGIADNDEEYWPIYRQDQLQEMIKDKWHGIQIFKSDIGEYFLENREYGLKLKGIFTSIEQLWLAFVMHEKYQKIWNNEKWIKDR